MAAPTVTPVHSRWRWLRPLVVLGILSAALAWSVVARVPVYVVSGPGPLDVSPALSPVTAPVTGQVRLASMLHGQAVQAGDLLVELNATEQQLQVAEERQRLQALEAQRTARQQEYSAAEAAWQAAEQGAQTVLDEARTRHQEAMVAMQTAQDKAQRFGPLALLAEQPQLKTAVDTTRLALQRLEHEQRVRALEWRVRQAQYHRELVVLAGELALTSARLERLTYALEVRRIHASMAGRLMVIAQVVPGTVVHEGERLGVIIPPGALMVTASFPTTVAQGRVHAGQAAQLSWASAPEVSSASLAATVAQVADAASEMGVQVMLRLAPEALVHLPLQRTLAGSAAIEVERVPPLGLLLRALRQRFQS